MKDKGTRKYAMVKERKPKGTKSNFPTHNLSEEAKDELTNYKIKAKTELDDNAINLHKVKDIKEENVFNQNFLLDGIECFTIDNENLPSDNFIHDQVNNGVKRFYNSKKFKLNKRLLCKNNKSSSSVVLNDNDYDKETTNSSPCESKDEN